MQTLLSKVIYNISNKMTQSFSCLSGLFFSINVKTNQSKPVKRMARIQSLSGNISRGHQHMLSESLRRDAHLFLSFVTTVPVVSVDPGSHFKVLLHIVHMLACACILTRLHCRQLRPVHRTGRLLARAGCVSLCCKLCVYGICAFVLRCFFFCSHTVLLNGA